ncbi:MAG TPA: ArsR family transcriptional regulator [Gemmatimonadaceae bacterium]|nr:ArsR family transcriptional regulator [Gemmatimonadaceae bacterium]
MVWWQRQLGKTTRSRLVALLRRGQRTVDELAAALGLTDNAVRAHLTALERENVVHAIGVRREGTVGKPATLYEIAADSSAVFSTAYSPVLGALLAELRERMTPKQVESALRRTGKRLARSLPARATFDERARASANFLAGLGAEAELVPTAKGYEIRSHGCVLSAAVAECPATCVILEQMLRDVTGGTVKECCDRTAGGPNCRFMISPAA